MDETSRSVPADILAEALAHHRGGRLAEAEQAYRRILARQPDEPQALHLLGVVALQTGHMPEAERLLRLALQHLPASAEVHSNLGLMLAAAGRLDAAIALFKRAIELHPGYAEADHNLGLALQHTGAEEAALAHYARAVELKPDYGDALCHLAMALHNANRPAEAAPFYRRAIAAEAGLERLWTYLGLALASCGDAAGAQTALEQARVHNSGDPLVALCEALLAHQPGNVQSELELVRRRHLVTMHVRDSDFDPLEGALRDALSAGTTFVATARDAHAARKAAPAGQAAPNDLPELPLIAYAVGHASPIQVAPAGREWMDRSRHRFAYRCLPMVIANQSGWFLLNTHRLVATWDGSDSAAGLVVEALGGPGAMQAHSHFGHGILTWQVPYVFRTPPGYNLYVRGPANWPKDGACALEGVVESDWIDATFTMNWQLTRPDLRVVFEAGEPIAMISPQKRGEIERFRPEIRPIASDPELELRYGKWSAQRDRALGLQRDPNARERADWQRHYMLGLTATMEAAPEHQTGLSLRAFTDTGSDARRCRQPDERRLLAPQTGSSAHPAFAAPRVDRYMRGNP